MLHPIPSFTFASAGTIRFGRGQAAAAAGLCAGYGPSVLLVHGRSGARAAWLLDDLHAQGCRVTALACAQEPTLPMLERASQTLRAQPPDVVVSLGGGSVIDLGKALAALIPSDCAPLDHLEGLGQGLPLTHAPLPFIALPTTAGTGAEVTKNAVINLPEHHCKVSLRDARMVPDVAIIDPTLMQTAPKPVLLAAGLDAITQVIEPYVCSKATPMTDVLCRAAIPTGLTALIQLMSTQSPEPDAMDAIAWTSLCGGLALANAGLGAVHGLAGIIGGLCGAPHGAICGALLPHVVAANLAAAVPGSTAHTRLSWVCNTVATAFAAPDHASGLMSLESWARDHGLPSLGQLGVLPGQWRDIAAAALGASSMQANPVALTEGDLVSIMAKAG